MKDSIIRHLRITLAYLIRRRYGGTSPTTMPKSKISRPKGYFGRT